jgi:hypothetical protein
MDDIISFTVQLIGDQAFNVTLPHHSSMSELAKILEKRFPDIDLQTVKLLHKAKVLRLDQYANLKAAGITHGAKIKLMASKKTDIAAVQKAREPPAMPSFEHEEQRERARQSTNTSSMASTETRFARFEEWNLPELNPAPSEARTLLHRLASDPGILGVMKKHGWKVGLLSEMPPEGKVGISPVCLLGFNMNKGQEISLRLRTDDLKGFRRYDSIRLTLIHELAHMVCFRFFFVFFFRFINYYHVFPCFFGHYAFFGFCFSSFRCIVNMIYHSKSLIVNSEESSRRWIGVVRLEPKQQVVQQLQEPLLWTWGRQERRQQRQLLEIPSEGVIYTLEFTLVMLRLQLHCDVQTHQILQAFL